MEKNKDEKFLANYEWNEEKTAAFVTTKQKRRNDSISWMVTGLVILFITVFSLGRITVIGQFLDDVFFNFIFGWFKYFIYIVLFIVDLCIFSGIRFKFKKRFLFMVISSFILLCWLISLILFTQIIASKNENLNKLWQANFFAQMFNVYAKEWVDHSIFSGQYYKEVIDYFLKTGSDGYFNLYSGGGITGTLMVGITSYLSIVGSYILLVFLMFINGMWIFTGDPIFLFKPKAKRKGKALRILTLKSKRNPNSKRPVAVQNEIHVEPKNEKNGWESINVFGNMSFDEEQEIKTSDLTIQMPSYVKKEDKELLDKIYQEQQLECSLPEEVLDSNYIEQNMPNENDLSAVVEEQQLDPHRPRFVSRRVSENNQVERVVKNPDLRPITQNNEMLVKSENILNINEELKVEEIKDTTIDGDDTFFDAIYEEQETKKVSETLEALEALNKYEEKYDLKEESPLQKEVDTPIISAVEEPIIQAPLIEEPVVEEPQIIINKNYKLPPVDVLAIMEKDYNKERANKENAALKALAIDETFKQFGVKAKVINSIIGPSVMKFEIQAEPGVKVNSITNLENDLKLALATQNMRLEAPIPGKNLIGIELANASSEMVSMREIIESIPKEQENEKLLFVLGKNVLGEPLTAQLNKMPHLLVAGSTGSGKSVMINALICSILLRAKPNEVKFLMIDPKKVELSVYSRVPHMLAPVISDMKQAANALKMVVAEMERRYELFMSLGVRNIDGYNRKVTGSKKMPFQVIIIDELADLMMTGDRKQVEESIMRITQMARAAGIHLIVATQRPSTDVITGTIKTNIPTRIAFAVTTGIDSRTILDSTGAENLLGRGDMLFMPPGGGDLMRAQGAYLSDEEIEEIVDFTIAQQQAVYADEFDQDNLKTVGSTDELYSLVKEFVIEKQDASSSSIKGKFRIADARATNILNQLEDEGVVGPKNGSRPREVLVKK
ncbi:Cell division protein FtsK [Mesoplasma florum W37]|uniref:Cell division protein FtsK n=1 Tax=Mesoplasma florum TaxID=2151 RepID=A0AAD2PSJ4_MESFO|nr:DNA translocase FtsK [Mesoplasma florum]AGY41174.1 Cell division protein FtsK [Mesoplasma florum W37]AVN59405.1 DNA translocase (stage III sporulation protein E) [Mesoplasma florum]AVN65512.1 Cell division protein FtsK [Mesoplasma florum]